MNTMQNQPNRQEKNNKQMSRPSSSQTPSNMRDMQSLLRKQWPNFSDEDLSAIEEDKEVLKTRLEKVYGYSKDRAEREYRTFMGDGHKSPDAFH